MKLVRSLLLALIPIAVLADEPQVIPDRAVEINKKLGRGINLGNALEAPSEGEWGVTLKAEYFDRIKEAGFQSIRLPVRWATHTGPAPDFVIDPKYLDRVAWALDGAQAKNLAVVVNAHHDDELYQEPDKFVARLEATWRQVARRFGDRPDSVVFELLNEPHGNLTDERWNALFPQLLAIVRESNPNRAVIVGPGHWNGVDSFKTLRFPQADRMLIATFHYYSPFHFTHQGAEWAEGSSAWKGETWRGTPKQLKALRADFAKVEKWAADNDRPIYLGEFGSYRFADMTSRTEWTAAVAREAERLGFSWAYWEFAAGFGAFDRDTNQWRAPLKSALVP